MEGKGSQSLPPSQRNRVSVGAPARDNANDGEAPMEALGGDSPILAVILV